MIRPHVKYALKQAKKALRQCEMEANRENILKVLVNYYGLSQKEIEEIRI